MPEQRQVSGYEEDVLDQTNRHYVYALPHDPNDPIFGGLPCYIGMGTNGRKDVHLSIARSGKPQIKMKAFYSFLSDCLARGFQPQAYILFDGLTSDEAARKEAEIIDRYGRIDLETGCLLNRCAGGFGSRSPCLSSRQRMSERRKGALVSLETRERISRAHKGKTLSPEHLAFLRSLHVGRVASESTRRLMSAAHLGKKMSPEAIEKSRLAALGRKRDPSVGEKISAALKGRSRSSEQVKASADGHRGLKHTADARAKISAGLKGKQRSVEHRAALSASLKGRVVSDESRAKQSATIKGRKKSPETREKMRLAALEREAKKRAVSRP